MTKFEKELLELLSMLNEKLSTMESRLEDTQRVVVSVAEDVSTVRSRVIEDASRDGQTQHQHQRAIQELDARVRKLELA